MPPGSWGVHSLTPAPVAEDPQPGHHVPFAKFRCPGRSVEAAPGVCVAAGRRIYDQAITLRQRRLRVLTRRIRRSALTASRCRSLRWRCRSGHSARHPPITRRISLIPLAVRDAGAGWSWPHRYGGASRVRKSIVPPGCWAGGLGASALREGSLNGSPDECTIRAYGSAVTGPAASAGPTPFAPSAIAPWRRRRNAPSRVPPSPPACAPGRERDGRQRCRTARVTFSPGGNKCWRR